METYIIIALLTAVLILLIILLLKQGRDGSAEKIDSIFAEIQLNRRENAERDTELKNITSQSLLTISDKIEKMRIDSIESQSKTENTLVKSLAEIRINDAEQNQKQGKMISDALDRMRDSNEKKLEQMRMTVDEKLTATLSSRLDSSFKTVSERLENVYTSLGEMKELSNGVTANVTALNRVLTNVKARGTWAEVQLGSILDQTVPGMYETNFAAVPGSKDRVEFAIRIPSGDDSSNITYLPIDSKFPMEDYIRLCSAADSADSEMLSAARKALEARILSEAKSVSKYINVPLTTPFAIMYLATEGLYAEIASSKTGIGERIRSEYNIMIAGPSTITALLNSLSLGFRAIAINEKANEVRLLLAAAKVQYDKFGTVLKKARQKIDEAGKSLDEADKRNDIIQKKMRKVEEIDNEQADMILGIGNSEED